jgi:hypothetical protein
VTQCTWQDLREPGVALIGAIRMKPCAGSIPAASTFGSKVRHRGASVETIRVIRKFLKLRTGSPRASSAIRIRVDVTAATLKNRALGS